MWQNVKKEQNRVFWGTQLSRISNTSYEISHKICKTLIYNFNVLYFSVLRKIKEVAATIKNDISRLSVNTSSTLFYPHLTEGYVWRNAYVEEKWEEEMERRNKKK